ncbi:hypothetical protein LXT21_12620 [Myxococcus sp. K38C18041901]|uniref:hypothetical protein n=1 Tax=Myxococcus guangdongensis TaxID=2906760 RepID=UPI0020A7BFAD|nr:hypothetical protein [Myxococcus guangdongensis]MCP3059622.1 hypothetical protein [Myxococcus guangdongensis]
MGTSRDFPAAPDMEALVGCARQMAVRIGAEGVSDAELAQVIQRVLFGEKDGWACAVEGLLTRTEAANLVLAHLESWLVDRTGWDWDAPLPWGRDTFVAEAEQALFGAR